MQTRAAPKPGAQTTTTLTSCTDLKKIFCILEIYFQTGKNQADPSWRQQLTQTRRLATARFAGAEEDEPQFEDAPGEETEDSQDWPQYGEEKSGTSKLTGKAGDQPQPPPVNPTPGTSKDPTPSTSKDPTDAPRAVHAQDLTQDPTEAKAEEVEVETPPELTAYVKSYKLAGKNWLDMVLDKKEQAYDTLYDRLVKIGTPHKEYLDQAVREQVFASIKDRSGKCLSKDNFAKYVEKAESPKKQRYKLTDDDAKEALKDYYNAVAQANLAHSTKVLKEKIEDKTVFLDIIRQMQLPAVQVSVRTVEEEEQLKNMTYRDVTLHTHLPDFRRINPNATEQTRTLAAFMYFFLYEQITGLQALQTGCATEFRCQTTPIKRLVTGKKQPGGPGRGQATKSGRSLEEVAEMEGGTPGKKAKATPKTKPKATPKAPLKSPSSRRGRGRGRGKAN